MKIMTQGQSHLVAYRAIERTGYPAQKQYVLYLLQDGCRPILYTPFSKYLWKRHGLRRLSWQRDSAQAIGLLLEYFIAHRGDTGSRQDKFEAFAQALVAGTIDDRGDDQSGLGWSQLRRTERAQLLLGRATDFTDWLANETGTTPLNEWRMASVEEQIVQSHRWQMRRSRSMLAHLDTRPSQRMVRSARIARRTHTSDPFAGPAFDSRHFSDLLTKGMARQLRAGQRRYAHTLPIHRRLHLRNVLIAILYHGAGLRLDEPFHLFVDDVFEDPERPGHAIVRLFHPEDGAAPADPMCRGLVIPNREVYLKQRWNLRPRTLLRGRFAASWKENFLTDPGQNYAQVYWFHPDWARIFFELYCDYLLYCRPHEAWHPYLFCSEDGEERGDPYTFASMRQAHACAVERIGLKVSKGLGTTPHGHRHAYAQELRRAGVPMAYIQRALHHKSPFSQEAYTAPTPFELNRLLQQASHELRSPNAAPWTLLSTMRSGT